MLYDVTQVIANVPVNVTTSPEARGAVGDILGKIAKQLNHSFPTLDPVKHMKIDSSRVVELQRYVEWARAFSRFAEKQQTQRGVKDPNSWAKRNASLVHCTRRGSRGA